MGTPNTLVTVSQVKPWIQTSVRTLENLLSTTLSFALMDLLGSCQHKSKRTREVHLGLLQAEGGRGRVKVAKHC